MATNPFNTQSFIQPIAQANTPFLANNGNPGTVYNIPATGGYVPPQSDANNNWAVNPLGNFVMPAPASAYANNRFWENLGGGTGTGGPRFVIPPNTGGGTTPTPWPPGTQPPVTGDPPPTTPPGGTTTPPGSGGVDPDYPLNNGPGGTWSPPGGVRPGNTTGGNNLSKPSTGPTSNIGQWLTTGQGGQLLGMNPDGTISWQQLVDLVSEPWVQGNLYMSNTGQWNPQNIVRALANTVIPGAGNLLQTLGAKGIFGNTVKQWIIEGRFAEAENAMVGMMEELEAWDRADGTNYTGTNPQLGGTRGGVPYTPWGYSGNIKDPGAGVKSPGSLVKNPNAPTNSRDKGSAGANDKGNSGGLSTGGDFSTALNNASIYWMLDSTSRQAQDAMRRMFEHQRQ